MKTLQPRSAISGADLTTQSPSRPKTPGMPTSEQITTADRLLFLKDCLDKQLIDDALFRALRDELTYGLSLA